MPGVVKIGRTSTSIEQRLKELNTTGIPTKFEIEAVFSVESSHLAEKAAHKALKRFRLSTKREFFKLKPSTAISRVISEVDGLKLCKARRGLDVEQVVQFHADKKLAEQRANELRMKDASDARKAKITRLLVELRKLENDYLNLGPMPLPKGEWWEFLLIPFRILMMIEKLIYLFGVIGVMMVFEGELKAFFIGVAMLIIGATSRYVIEKHQSRQTCKYRQKTSSYEALRCSIDRKKVELRKLGHRL